MLQNDRFVIFSTTKLDNETFQIYNTFSLYIDFVLKN